MADGSAAWVADRLAALNAAANRHGGDHELSAVCSHLHSELPKLAAEVERLRQGLWDCASRTGFDNDGDSTPEALAHPDIVALALREVERLRADYDEAIS